MTASQYYKADIPGRSAPRAVGRCSHWFNALIIQDPEALVPVRVGEESDYDRIYGQINTDRILEVDVGNFDA